MVVARRKCSIASSSRPSVAKAPPRPLWAMVVSGSQCEGSGPKGLAVAPKGGLTECAADEHRQQRSRGRAARPTTVGPSAAQVGDAPDQPYCQPNLRQVREPIGHRRAANLQQPDDGHQHSQVPEPTDQQVRASAPAEEGRRRDARQNQAGGANLPPRQVEARTRIYGDQADRIEELAQIRHVGDGGVAQPPP